MTDRDLIDAALAEGRVTVCPPATFSSVMDRPWDFGFQCPVAGARRPGAKHDPAVAERRKEVLALVRKGVPVKDIAALLSVPANIVHGDIGVLRSRGHEIVLRKPVTA